MPGPVAMEEVLKKEPGSVAINRKNGRGQKSSLDVKENGFEEGAPSSLKAIDNCPACQGAVFKYSGKGRGYGSWEEKNLSQCLFCGRIYTLSDKGYRQWPPRPKKNNKEKLTEDFRLSCE